MSKESRAARQEMKRSLRKGRKLMPKEKERLKELEGEIREAQKKLEEKKAEVLGIQDSKIQDVTKTATERVRAASARFVDSKRQLELKKKAAIASAEKNYQRELSLLHSEKSGVCQAAEAWMEQEQVSAANRAQGEIEKLEKGFQKFLEKNKAAQEEIRKVTRPEFSKKS